jgi:RHS repeat-associated protein
MIKNGHGYQLVTDHLESVRLVVDVNSGDVVQRLEYDEYGNVLSNTNEDFQPFAYAGGLYDSQTKLVRFGARDYDASAGRWTCKDPIGFGGGGEMSLYEYVSNDPINYTDPEGTKPQEAYGSCIKIGGSLSWRNNNPGNIIYGQWATAHGAIRKSATSKFAVFPNESSGMQALKDLLKDVYGDKTVAQLINIYAPASDDNDPETYLSYLEDNGISRDSTVKDVVDNLAIWIKNFEGWIEGETKCNQK